MGKGDVKNMSVHDFVWFLVLVGIVGLFAIFVLFRMCYQLMFPNEMKRRMTVQDMVEMQDLMEQKRTYEGRIYLPVGC